MRRDTALVQMPRQNGRSKKKILSLLANLLSERAERERHASTHHLGCKILMEFQAPCLISQLSTQVKNAQEQLKKKEIVNMCVLG